MNMSVSCRQVNQRRSERERDEPEKPRALLPGEVPRSEVQHRDGSPQQLRVSRRDRSAAGQVACTLQNACMCDFPQVFCVHFFLNLKARVSVLCRKVQIQHVLRVCRGVELQTFKSGLGNIKPLLHSSSPSNFVGVLSR